MSAHRPPHHRPPLLIGWLGMAVMAAIFPPSLHGQTITNLHQLTAALSSDSRIERDVDLETTVCAASRPALGVLIVQDETGVELLQLGKLEREFAPGERIRIRHQSTLLRKREMGVQISAAPVVSNDGLHSRTAASADVFLHAGKIPIRLEWFNYWRSFALDVAFGLTNEHPRLVEAANLWHAAAEPGQTGFHPGLQADHYEGAWESVPDFNLLEPARRAVVSNFDLSIKSRDERVGIRYSGYLDVPRDGQYRFVLWSDDGALLFLGNPDVPVASLGSGGAPVARPSELLGTSITNLDERCWTTVEGRVSFVSPVGEGVRFDLGADRRVISVRLADAKGLDLSSLLDSRVRITGIGRGVMTQDKTLVLGKLFAAGTRNLIFLEQAPTRGTAPRPITSVAEVQGLPIEQARRSLPVRIRGIVTDAMKTSQEHWMSFQDDTRGIFVQLAAVSNAAPAFGELWEVEGHSAAGDFAPVIVADQVRRLGEGLLPPPVTPSWTELLNGSRDVQWAELKGLVTDVHTNMISLHLPEGRLDVVLDGLSESELRPHLRAVIRIRGVLYALWEPATREVRVGRVMMRNARISVDVPASADPFDAVLKTPRELLLFDAQASAFRPVKVRGQIIYADATQLFLEENGTGLRLLPTGKAGVSPGDLVEAVGYPDIGRAELVLREAQVRKTGWQPLPPPKSPDASNAPPENLNSSRVRVEGRLLGWHTERGSPVLEMQSGARLFLARLARGPAGPLSLRVGSRLGLVGVYVGRGHAQNSSADNESFELLLNSPADIIVRSQPSWWTLPRLLALVGVLFVILIFTVIWNTQLRRLVEQRTTQLKHEISERERVEHRHALEAERSRIARDLHDDLGFNLTEISVLAKTGEHAEASGPHQPGLFQAIGSRARSLISALDVIVWAVDPEDNSLQSLADYLSGYTGEFFSHTPIACRFKVPVSFPPITLEGRVRHDLLMAVKEALNNVVRHADATEVEFRMAIVDGSLEIDIADNGKGIDDEAQGNGHGLKNLPARLQKLGGDCVVEPRADGGTIVRIRLPLGTAAGGQPVDAHKS